MLYEKFILIEIIHSFYTNKSYNSNTLYDNFRRSPFQTTQNFDVLVGIKNMATLLVVAMMGYSKF